MVENSSELPPKRRVVGHPFPKVVSPNPGGRPKALSNVQTMFREYTEDALKGLLEFGS